MSLRKDEIVELVEKTDNGWWLVKKNGAEGWAPNNYLVLVPSKPKATPTPPPPPPPPTQRKVPALPQAATTTPAVKPPVKSLAADSNAKPVSVFPGMGPSNGSATPWKKSTPHDLTDDSPHGSRPNSSLANRPPPPVATKPKPGPPPIASKPNISGGNGGPPKISGKPPIPTTQRPTGASRPVPPKPGAKNPPAVGGQLDLAAAVSKHLAFFY